MTDASIDVAMGRGHQLVREKLFDAHFPDRIQSHGEPHDFPSQPPAASRSVNDR